jgi:hypothetical protein
VTNSSFYSDPWYFNCVTDPDQRAIVDAINRSTRYAWDKGAVNVVAALNENYDLSAPTLDEPFSPSDGTPEPRTIDTSKCELLPAESPDTVTVSAVGAQGIKSSFSNYGQGITPGNGSGQRTPKVCAGGQRSSGGAWICSARTIPPGAGSLSSAGSSPSSRRI